MIRTLFAVALAATFGLSLSACQPRSGAATGEQTGGLSLGDPVPEIYDWHFLNHGPSGELTFGDEDFAEGVSLFRLTCAPRSRTVEVSWGYPGEAVLTSGTATGTFRAGQTTQSDHPVFTALRDNGVLAVGLSGADLTLKAKGPGRAGLTAFFDYCERGIEPPAPAVAPVIEPVPVEEGVVEEAVPTEPVDGDAPAEPATPAPVEPPAT